MELTWKLRPNAFWHDGTPLKASDFIFGTEVARDPEAVGTPPALGTKLLSEMLAPDDHTFVVRFPQPYVYANLGHNTPPLPAHHLREAYQRGDRQAFENHAYWTSEFIGLGPYKLARWERGSFLEGLANDQYFLGRPKIDRLRQMRRVPCCRCPRAPGTSSSNFAIRTCPGRATSASARRWPMPSIVS
jgi:peptide/nickel transport system substrate-binding protein